jgi:hypothetical protein
MKKDCFVWGSIICLTIILSGCASRGDSSANRDSAQTNRESPDVSQEQVRKARQDRDEDIKNLKKALGFSSKGSIREIENFRLATETEVSSIVPEVQRRMNPYTIEEIQKRSHSECAALSPNGAVTDGFRGSFSDGKKRTFDGRTVTVSVWAEWDGVLGVVKAEFIERGEDIKSKAILSLDQRDAGSSVWFKNIVLIDAGVCSEFQKNSAGQWEVRKYETVAQ